MNPEEPSPQFEEKKSKEEIETEIAHEVKAKFNDLLDFGNYKNEDDCFKVIEEIRQRMQELEGRYPDYYDYLLYHMATGNTPDEKNPPAKFDFSGEDSVARFIDEMYDKYVKDKE